MNDFYIEYMIKSQMREELEACRRRRLLKQESAPELRSNLLAWARSAFCLFGFKKTREVSICRDIGISGRTPHRHFRSLGEVVEALKAR